MYDIWELRKKYYQHVDLARKQLSDSMYEKDPASICLCIDQAIGTLENIKRIVRGSMPEEGP